MRKIAIISAAIMIIIAAVSCAPKVTVNQDSSAGVTVTGTVAAAASVGTATVTFTATKTLVPTATFTPTQISKDEAYYPIYKGNTLYFKGYRKKEPSKELKVKAEVVGIEQRDGKDYAYFYAPQMNVRYLIRRDKEGVYMRVIRYPFPIFDFSIEVNIKPEMKIISFPLKTGQKWEYKGRAETLVFGFMNIGRDIKSTFEAKEKRVIKTWAGDLDTVHMQVLVDEGDGGTPKLEKYWYAKGFGYSVADTSGHYAELVGYKIYDEANPSKINEKIPEGAGDYK